MGSRAEAVGEYVVWLLKKYQEIKQVNNENAYKVIKVKKKNFETTLVIQMSGKSTVFEAKPQEIIAKDEFMEFFSKKDIRLISALAFDQEKPKSKIVLQEFCEKVNRTIFSIFNARKNKVEKLSAGDIAITDEVLETMSPKEALSVGYTMADDAVAQEREALRKMKEGV